MSLKSSAAERLAVAVLKSLGYEVARQEGKAGLVKIRPTPQNPKGWFNRSRDIFGSVDVIGKASSAVAPLNDFGEPAWEVAGGPKPQFWFIQVTTRGSKTKRRRKLEQGAWHAGLIARGILRVSIWTHEEIPDPCDFRRKRTFFRIEDLSFDAGGKMVWTRKGALKTDRFLKKDPRTKESRSAKVGLADRMKERAALESAEEV